MSKSDVNEATLPLTHQIIRENNNQLVRRIGIGDRLFETVLKTTSDGLSPSDDWWLQIIKGQIPKIRRSDTDVRQLNIADLFCGSGGFSNGVRMAANALGLDVDIKFAVDTDVSALDTYKVNHRPRVTIGRSVKDIIDSQIIIKNGIAKFYYDPVLVNDQLEEYVGNIDLVVAGPPCQGHSNLNNHTRRDDVRNALYPTAAEIAVAVGARGILIENVPAVLHDKYESVRITKELLGALNWSLDDAVISATALGWPQTRKRHFLSASIGAPVTPLKHIMSALSSEPRSLGWLLEDILDLESSSFMDHVGNMSELNIDRINFLFDNDLYTLPDHIRPKSHQDGNTYPSSYGRMYWDKPAGTITTGFMTPGRGRFIHPLRRRPITAREAARIQGFPDSFRFGEDNSPPPRALLAKWIGDAVPGPLGYAAALSVLAALV